MGKRRALELGLLIGTLLTGCATERNFSDGAGGGAGNGAETAGAPAGGSDSSCAEDEFDDGDGCRPVTVCASGTYVAKPPTATTDRACSACADGTFSSALNAAACAEWSTCNAGESESVPPSATSDRVCSRCGAGKYEADGGCEPLTVCGDDQYESTPATATSDRTCDDVQSCEPGNRQTAAPTTTTDRQCAPCADGTFSTQRNATTCKAWTACGANQAQTKAGTPTSDVVCVDKPLCSTAADRACSIDCPCASGEGVCTASNQCVSGASCVAGSGKKVGRAGDTCLADHCNNDTKDSGETSVDCGGECGCRATYEVVPLKGIPANTNWGEYTTLSRDGKRLAGYLNRNRTSYPATIAADGTVTELQAFGKAGSIASATADGSVLVGGIGCADPPSCTDTTWSIAKWSGSSAPTVTRMNATARGASSSGSVIAGDFYDSSAGQNRGFILNGNSWLTINDLSNVVGITPDGKYVAGSLPSGVQGGLWEAQTQKLTKIGSASWTSTTVSAINGTSPALAGYGYSSPDTYIGYRWKGGTLTQLGVLAGGVYTMPAAVSLDGSTVVGYTGSNSFQQAFIWTDQDKLRTIVDELLARGFEPPVDLKLTYAEFVSDDGKTIVGYELSDTPSFWRVVLQ